MSIPRCRIRRSKRRTVIGYVGGSVAAGVALGLMLTLWRHPAAASFAAVPLAFALILFWMAVAGSGYAPCPGCSTRIENLSLDTNDGVLCRGCRKYLEGREGYLKRTSDDRVAETPLFGVTLPETLEWPWSCCLCEKASSRREPISLDASSPAGAVKIEVPHCADHQGGADLLARGKRVRIRFRSYAYFRAFCERNKVKPD